MKIQKVPAYFRVFDYLLFPLMWILCGFKLELPQETHRWHMRNYPSIKVPKNKIVKITGDDPSRHSVKGFPFYHIPLLGGWKKYIILEAKNYRKFWNVGWIVEFKDRDEVIYQIQGARIYSPFIKLLKGISDSDKTFFAVGDDGNFADIKQIDEGVLGDGKYRSVRFF
ncbi:MAG: hypothetical protein HYW63_00445 [Candidatus Levybacteria bacterium]|nr:hypothetical protein [Candidatus Levybacteria bacterium]